MICCLVRHGKDDDTVRGGGSGQRSKLAAEALVELGYTNIKEFGGIIDWTYEVEK